MNCCYVLKLTKQSYTSVLRCVWLKVVVVSELMVKPNRILFTAFVSVGCLFIVLLVVLLVVFARCLYSLSLFIVLLIVF
jgi:hypothetical protein